MVRKTVTIRDDIFHNLELNHMMDKYQSFSELVSNALQLLIEQEKKEEYKKALNILKENITKEVSLGKRARLEELKVDASLQDITTQINSLESNINILKSSLAVLINQEEDFELAEINEINEGKIENKILEKSSYFDKIENLSSYKLLELDLKKAKNEYEKSKSSYYPKITANTQYVKVYSNDGDDDKIWQAGLALSWNIFDFGKTSSLVQKAKIAQTQASLELEKRKLELKQKITEAISKIEQNSDLFLGAKKEFMFTSESEKIEKIRYEQEAIDIYEKDIACILFDLFLEQYR